MPTIKLATTMANEMALDILTNSNSTVFPSFGNSRTGVQEANIRIMSGTIPTQNDIDNAYPTWGRIVGSPNDVLVEFDFFNGYAVVASGSDSIEWQLASETAIATGTASWWMWSGNQVYTPGDRPDAPGAPDGKYLPCIIGTIGQAGGGSPLGDLQLVDINIVAGQQYDIGPFYMQVPRTFTW